MHEIVLIAAVTSSTDLSGVIGFLCSTSQVVWWVFPSYLTPIQPFPTTYFALVLSPTTSQDQFTSPSSPQLLARGIPKLPHYGFVLLSPGGGTNK